MSIPENSSKEVTLKVKMPEKRQTGVIMGGIVVSEQKRRYTKN
ncbi:MAG: WxL protein peptidoglycan domain-containing protein [Enterococcus raffinosus]